MRRASGEPRGRVSVIVPAFNAEQTIGACLESLLRQTQKPLEIIVVDDCSTDATAEVARRFGVTVIRLDRNGGPGVARNAGAERAAGDILAFTDSDCVAPPNWLARMVGALDEPSVVAATGGYGGAAQPSFLARLQHLALARRQASLPPNIHSTISSNLVCRTSAFRGVGGFPLYYTRRDPTKPVWGNEDEELGFLLAQAGGEIRWVGDVGVLHAFRGSLAGYLRQQWFYAHSIMISHARFPAMAKGASNYSRSSGALQVLAALGTLLGATGAAAGRLCPDTVDLAALSVLCGEWLEIASLTLLAVAGPLYLLSPAPLLARLRGDGERLDFLLRAYPVLLAVIMAWLAGVLSGTLSALGGFVDGNRKRSSAPSAPDQ